MADIRYQWRKRSLEDRIIRAARREDKALCVSLHCELSALNWARIYALADRTQTRNCKLYLVK